MWWYISSLVNEWEWCIILESDTGILGKKEIRVLLSGVKPNTSRLLVLILHSMYSHIFLSIEDNRTVVESL